MTTNQITKGSTIRCNRCNKPFPAPKPLTAEPYNGQPAARIEGFCTCPHCDQTDCHWIYASDEQLATTKG